jgi:hypothetical protein
LPPPLTLQHAGTGTGNSGNLRAHTHSTSPCHRNHGETLGRQPPHV